MRIVLKLRIGLRQEKGGDQNRNPIYYIYNHANNICNFKNV